MITISNFKPLVYEYYFNRGISNSLISVVNLFGDSEEGRRRLYQTSDVVLLLLNNEMEDSSGVCYSHLHAPEGSQKEYRFAVFVAPYSKIALYSFKRID